MAPSKAGNRLFVVLQAVIDESYRHNGVFVLGGYIADAEAWANFARCWEQMLPHGTLNRNNRYHFKMSEMAQHRDRMLRVSGFFRIIENHVIASVSCKIDIAELGRARNRLWVPGVPKIDWGFVESPYLVAFRCLMDHFHATFLAGIARAFRAETNKVNFYFDDQTEKSAILQGWASYLAERPDVSDLYGDAPVFRRDEEFLPLQAADFWAWWVRKWYEEDTRQTAAI